MPTHRTAERKWTASQVVAHNLSRARELRGLTQVQVAERLSRFTGTKWSQATVAQAEGSVSGQRIRQFTANELVALARTFDLPPQDALPNADVVLAELTGQLRHRQPLEPEDVLAAALHGLAARRMRGANQPGEEVAKFAENLRGLADALMAFNNYKPGAFVDETVVEEIAEGRDTRSGKAGRGKSRKPSGG